jgi:mono/diheme cytochrome c family protein
MRKILFTATLFAVVTLIVFACTGDDKKNETTASVSKEDSLKAVVEHGKYLVTHVAICVDCHTKRDFTKFAGPIIWSSLGGGGDTFGAGEGVPGEITPPNITPHALKDWTDDEIERAITQGINKKGDTLFPIMPYNNYNRMAKSDIRAIIAYIRTLSSVESTIPPKKLMIPASMYGPLPQNKVDANVRPDPSDKIKYGEYLTTFASCSDCHTPMTQQGPDFSKMFAGGFVFDLPGLFKVTVPNITPDSTTGIGSWSEEMFLAKFKTNVAAVEKGENPGKMNTMMPWGMYGKMKEDDLKAIYAYLRTVPSIKNKVEKWPTK